MAIRTAYALHSDIPEWAVETVEIPVGETYQVGDAIVADSLRTGSLKVYEGSQVADITKEKPLMIIDQRFDELEDKRRPDGSNMLTDITFREGDEVIGVRPVQDMKFEISQASLGNTGVVTPAAGVFVIPANGENKWQTAASIGTAIVAYKIEAVTNIPTGGNMALGYDASAIIRCVLA